MRHGRDKYTRVLEWDDQVVEEMDPEEIREREWARVYGDGPRWSLGDLTVEQRLTVMKSRAAERQALRLDHRFRRAAEYGLTLEIFGRVVALSLTMWAAAYILAELGAALSGH